MRFPLFSSLALLSGSSLSLSATDPRIDILSPFAKVQHSEFEVIDLDGDGDQDFVIDPGNGSIDWFETLPSGKVSPPKQLHLPLDNFYEAHFIDSDDDGVLEVIGVIIDVTDSSNIKAELWHNDPLGSPRKSDFKKIANLDTYRVGFLQLNLNSPVSQMLQVSEASTNHFTLHEVSDQLTLEPWSSQVFELPSELDDPANNIHAFDLDGDGDSDLLILLESATVLFERTGELTFSETPVLFDQRYEKLADLDRDGDLDPYNADTTFGAWLNDGADFSFTHLDLPSYAGNITSITDVQSHAGSGVWVLDTPHWHPSNQEDLGTPSLSATISQLHLGEGGSWVTSQQVDLQAPEDDDPNYHSFIASVRSADLDQDDNLDFISHIIRLGQATNGTAIFHSSITGYNPTENGNDPVLQSDDYSNLQYHRPATGDFDDDGDIDVIVGPNHLNEHFLLLNDGSGTFTKDTTPLDLLPNGFPRSDYCPDFLTPIDFDRDGHLDLSLMVTEISSGKIACAILSGNGNGTFEFPSLTPESFESFATGFCGITEFIDWDLDGDLDAILDGGWRENIDGLLSESLYPLTQNVSVSDALGNPMTLSGYTIGDIDGDGAPDYVSLAGRLTYDPLDQWGGGLGWGGLYCASTGRRCKTEIAVAFNDGNGGIASVSYYESSLAVSDAFGNPVLGPCVAQDWNQDGTDELIFGEIESDPLGNPVLTGIVRVFPSKDSPRDLTSGFSLRSLGTIGTKRELTDFNADGTLEFIHPDGFVTPTPRGPLFSPRYDFIGRYDLQHLSSLYLSGGTVGSGPSRTRDDFINPVDFTVIPGIPSPTLYYNGNYRSLPVACADFDGDGDLDTLHNRYNNGLYLVRNLIVDERSPITAELIKKGLLGSEATPDADFDGDGLSNAHEYLYGTNPAVAQIEEPADLNPSWTMQNDLRELTFLRRRDADELKLDYRLERSTDLVNWEKIPFGDTESTPLNETWEAVTTKGLLQGGHYFYRTHPQHRP
ncbi:VCBS repeat-containing protein [Akkermansiaceae bacterium]|nr:VCBS repeat-containing protein [Akkermansiaceae bacterium]